MLRIGCCGFPVGLLRYTHELPVVEVQKAFYRIPGRDTVQRWRDRVPEDFIFTVKTWQGITHPATSPTYRRSGPIPEEMRGLIGHFRPTEPVFQGWRETRDIARILGAPLILLQAPPSFTETQEHEQNLTEFLSGIDREDIRIALELRASWDRARLASLCRKFDLIHCVDPFGDTPVTGPPFYLRLHGSPPGLRPVGSPSGLRPSGSPPGKRMYAYTYTETDLQWLRDRIRDWDVEGEVYCLFNNLSMWDDALAFRDLLRDASGRYG
ncbi:MAG TPA: DUF72 domain-containing protein [Methanomicrobiales archaeon]|nr:DUF72 domain-containing protein [Methanomicrobiales archaeon]